MKKMMIGFAAAAMLALSPTMAAAQTETGAIGVWHLGTLEDGTTCAMAAGGNGQMFGLAYNSATNTLLLAAENQAVQVPVGPVTVQVTIDTQTHDVAGTGEGDHVILATNSDSEAAAMALVHAEHFSFSVAGTQLVSVLSDADFEHAVTATFQCASQHAAAPHASTHRI